MFSKAIGSNYCDAKNSILILHLPPASQDDLSVSVLRAESRRGNRVDGKLSHAEVVRGTTLCLGII